MQTYQSEAHRKSATDDLRADTHKPSSSLHLSGLARGLAGSLLFSLPMLMTMEMWFLGFYMDRWRLILLLVINLPLLILLARRIGFERTVSWTDAARDAVIAYALGIIASAMILAVFGVITFDMSVSEWLGKIAIQAVPASIGAMLGRSQLGQHQESEEDDDATEANTRAFPEKVEAGFPSGNARKRSEETSYAVELAMMAVGALFLAFNMAPTEEMILIAYKMTPWHALALMILSILLMHGFVYALSFPGGHRLEKGVPGWHALIRFTLPGYVVALAISAYLLWSFGRLDDTAAFEMAMATIVLGFPAALGAAAARLIL
ncbi:TIGR02587 family membrane protein [Rhizobium paknamense]|uniref:Integral membrane protein (TIGR02587 family) n=1 Tax=Rhizobium paknamense TaxID=1206817 RepID=A0ABU0I999_9HYPH|nr:TIGR02587 family membrane protein [Rhizobium paknamense]MDQ0454810.1 putative integral membrane protein (TIGR02587 family) [Rhizobium paknamense]